MRWVKAVDAYQGFNINFEHNDQILAWEKLPTWEGSQITAVITYVYSM